ncbi:hypothetical protein [Blastococcus saxobsidens]|uniref:Uncharacterized protein n=1 Tax=Blastococcus saxobsidens (strain DD2) TaxID=1146883 RepID=H6RP05_BLASD|nr:hypothetical protein [Blastococcus saxobsidens]CCG01467.1 protein of unknown function [Blastococcus saxobsidens DD2]
MIDDGAFSDDGQAFAPGADRYLLRGWVELELALEGGVPVDAAHAVLSDVVVRAFGPGMFGWVAETLAAEGRDPQDLAALLDDEDLAERTLVVLHERMGEDDRAPEPPEAHLVWSAFSPHDPHGGRGAFRRAVRRRTENARRALLEPRRPRVAGRRDG